jgi:hypothetical protein
MFLGETFPATCCGNLRRHIARTGEPSPRAPGGDALGDLLGRVLPSNILTPKLIKVRRLLSKMGFP